MHRKRLLIQKKEGGNWSVCVAVSLNHRPAHMPHSFCSSHVSLTRSSLQRQNHPRSHRHTTIHTGTHQQNSAGSHTSNVHICHFFTFLSETDTGHTSPTANTVVHKQAYMPLRGSLHLLRGSLEEFSQFTVFSSPLSHKIIYGLQLHRLKSPEGNSSKLALSFSCC